MFRRLSIFVSMIMFVSLFGCAGGGGEIIHRTDEDVTESDVAQPECSVNSDCLEFGHSFCDNGVCNGEAPVQFEDVTADMTEEFEDDVVADSLTEEDVNLPECTTDENCQYLDDFDCSDGWLVTQVGVCNSEGHCEVSFADQLQCTNGCVETGCLPGSNCNNDEDCTASTGQFCTVDNQMLAWQGQGVCFDGLCQGWMEFFDCQGDCQSGQCFECYSDVDCDDDDACTDDQCAQGSCVHKEIQDCCIPDDPCDDGNICTEDFVDMSTCECVHLEIIACCQFDADCDDGNPCTDGGGKQPEKCIDNQCYIVPTPNYGLCGPLGSGLWCYEGECTFFDCDDGDVCTQDLVDSDSGECFHAPISGGPDDCPMFVSCGTDDDCGQGGGVVCLTDTIKQGSWSTGKCINGQCEVVIEQLDCPFGCDNLSGQCFDECSVDYDCGVGGGVFCLTDTIKQVVRQTGKCVNGQCEVVTEQLDCPFGCDNLSGQCFECAVDQNCDDGLDCTFDICEQGYCSTETKCYDIFDCVGSNCIHNTLTAGCSSDADCNFDPICDNTLGGVLEFTGACLGNGFCEMILHEDSSWGQVEGCFPAQPCADSSECEFGGVCEKHFCFWMNGKPECATDWDCVDFNACTDDVCTQGVCSNPVLVGAIGVSCSEEYVCHPDGVCGERYCDDNNSCTDDVYELDGSCSHFTQEYCEVCESDNDCEILAHYCDGSEPLIHIYNECLPSGKCSELSMPCEFCSEGVCLDCESNQDCADDNPCTVDSCANNHCQNTPVGNCVPCEVDADCVDLEPFCDWFMGGVVMYSGECDPYLNRCAKNWVFEDLGEIAIHGCAEPIECEFDADCADPSAWCTTEEMCLFPLRNIPPTSEDLVACEFKDVPDFAEVAVIWSGGIDEGYNLAMPDGIFVTTVDELCGSGTPSFLYNLWDMQSAWGNTSDPVYAKCYLGGVEIEVINSMNSEGVKQVTLTGFDCF